MENGLNNYGKKLVALGEKFQDEKTTIEDLVKASFELGLILSFRIEPRLAGEEIEIDGDESRT